MFQYLMGVNPTLSFFLWLFIPLCEFQKQPVQFYLKKTKQNPITLNVYIRTHGTQRTILGEHLKSSLVLPETVQAYSLYKEVSKAHVLPRASLWIKLISSESKIEGYEEIGSLIAPGTTLVTPTLTLPHCLHIFFYYLSKFAQDFSPLATRNILIYQKCRLLIYHTET